MSEIKVGSEWVDKRGIYEGFRVLFVGSKSVFARFEDGHEGSININVILKNYKPAPVRRTVWLNVYEDEVQCYNSKNKADNNIGYGLLYQQEVELIDPWENGK